MKILKLIVLILCLFVFYWGYHLVFHTYLNEREFQFMLKSGDLNITQELVEHYSLQINKTLFVQLGLIIVSVIIMTLVMVSFQRK